MTRQDRLQTFVSLSVGNWVRQCAADHGVSVSVFSLGEALRVLAACGVAPHAHLLLFLVSSGDHAIAWLQSDLAQFFEDFSGELPSALERVLGNQVHEVKPRWAKGTAHRVARLLSDHIDELERKDALLGDVFAGAERGHRG